MKENIFWSEFFPQQKMKKTKQAKQSKQFIEKQTKLRQISFEYLVLVRKRFYLRFFFLSQTVQTVTKIKRTP